MNQILRSLGLLALAGCSGLGHRRDVAAAVELVSEAELRRHVRVLATDIGIRPPHDDAASEATVLYLLEELRGLGYEPRREPYRARYGNIERQTGTDGKVSFRLLRMREVERCNVIAELPGSEDPEAVVEISAHYDTTFTSPGADDNASGVAGVLEAARVLREVRCRKTIRFVLFGSEEYGFAGSRAHLAGMGAKEQQRFLGLLNLDPIGFASSEPGSQVELVPWWAPIPGLSDAGDFIFVIGNFSSGPLGNRFEEAVDRYVPKLPYYSANRIGGWFADASRSDHSVYWEAGLPALFITDSGEFRNPSYHLPSDLPDTLNYVFLRQVVQATLATALHLAETLGPAQGAVSSSTP